MMTIEQTIEDDKGYGNSNNDLGNNNTCCKITNRIRSDTEALRLCCPEPVVIIEALPLYLSLVGLVLTYVGSWTCTYFVGANISITGGTYGLWTLQDVSGKCQLWDVLFFSYHWDPALEGARFLSMIGMLVGLAMFTTMVQAKQAHYLSYFFGFGIIVLFIVSASTSSIYNVWIIFWLSTYIIMTLIVRSLFIHPVWRRISKRGARYIGYLLLLCSASTLCTLSVLKSDYCTCSRISTKNLADRVRDDQSCQDYGDCPLSAAGYSMMAASVFWFAAAIATFYVGVQPSNVDEDPSKVHIKYAGYSRDSITTKVLKAISRGKQGEGDENKDSSKEKQEYDADGGIEVEPKTYVKDPNAVTEDHDNDHANARIEDSEAVNVGAMSDEVNESEAHDDKENVSREEGIMNEQNLDDDHDDEAVQRSRCQRLCCDFRVTKRTKREKRLFWCFRALLGAMVVIYVFLIILLIGSRWENRQAEQAPSTTHFFVTDTVCAYDKASGASQHVFHTFPTKEAAHAANYTVAHCGACAYCSNLPDIEAYVRTRKTIAKTAKECGIQALFGKHSELVSCLEERIDFTPDCIECWAVNMENTGKRCSWTCMKTLFTGFMSNNNVPGSGDLGWLNHCLQCDERLSGPAFVTCSGVARRRLGIPSEIERNPEEQCPHVDVNWVEQVDKR